VVTRVYFADEADANAADPILTSVGDTARRGTLIARADGDGYVFDIRLQGEGETVFFSI
jgi:protocatechuate 3,4-dioxygenase alpha subunit